MKSTKSEVGNQVQLLGEHIEQDIVTSSAQHIRDLVAKYEH